MKKTLLISKYKDSRCTIQPAKRRKNKIKSKKCTHRHGFIPKRSRGSQTYSAYKRQLSKAERKFVNVWLEKNKCLFVTLTTRDKISQSELEVHFKSLLRALRRIDAAISYIKAIDVFKKGKHYHLHVLLQFPNGIPKVEGVEINKSWFLKHWEWSSSETLDVQKPYKPYGCLDYLYTLKKKNVIDYEKSTDNKLVVKFDKYTRVITSGANLVYVSNDECTEVEYDEDGVLSIINEFVEEFTGIHGYKPFVRKHYSKWVDYETGEVFWKFRWCHIHP